MQNLSQNEFNQIAEMRSQLRDKRERIGKIRKTKNYEKMTNEEFIIPILKSIIMMIIIIIIIIIMIMIIIIVIISMTTK